MSGFWDAVDRAALGLPAAAVPRARTLFEPDDGLASEAAFDVRDEEIESTAPAASPSRPAVEAAMPAAAPPVDALALAREPGADGRAGVRGSEQPAPDTTAHRSEPPPPPQLPPVEAATRPPEARGETTRVERIEVHRTETIHRIDASLAIPPSERNDREAPGARPEADAEHREPSPVAPPLDMPAQVERMSVVALPPQAPQARPPEAPQGAPPPLVVEIDRIEIRIEPERLPAPAPTARRAPAPVPSLDEYLARRSQGTR